MSPRSASWSRAPAHHPDRAGRLGQDAAGNGNRAHAARRPARRRLARRARAPIGPDGDVAQAALGALGLRDALLGERARRGADRPAHRRPARTRDAAGPGQLRARDRVRGDVRPPRARRVPRLRILATSREPLGITGEALWPVAPLALPAEDASPGEIESAPAVRLLRDRASAVRTDLADRRRDVGDAGARSAARSTACRWPSNSPPPGCAPCPLDQLAHRLDDRFRLLTGGSRTALPRHRTLRAVVDWSWELLTDAERTVLRRLSVFAGGASLEAAEQVCAGSRGRQSSRRAGTADRADGEVAGGHRGRGAPRYRMLGTIREYAEQRLAEAGETDLGPARPPRLLHRTRRDSPTRLLRRAEQLRWLAILEAEHDNIAAAMRGALAAGEAAGAMRLAAAAGWYWWLGGLQGRGPRADHGRRRAARRGGRRDPGDACMPSSCSSSPPAAATSTTRRSGSTRRSEFGQRTSRDPHPALEFVALWERMFQAPDDVDAAFEPLLTTTTHGCARWPGCNSARCCIMVGKDGPEADE